LAFNSPKIAYTRYRYLHNTFYSLLNPFVLGEKYLNYLIAGLAKSGTTMLFSRMKQALAADVATFFEPDQESQFQEVLAAGESRDTLTKVLIGRVTQQHNILHQFDKHVVIYRDPRDQFISMLLYLFYDFQVNGDKAGYDACMAALTRKVEDPENVSTMDLYCEIAARVGRAPVGVFKKLHLEQRAYIDEFKPHPVCYESLLDGEYQDLQAYSGLNVGVDAQVPKEYSRVARSKGYGDWRLWLNKDDLAYVNAEWGETITRLGYPLLETPDALNIPTSTSTEYVKQFDPARS